MKRDAADIVIIGAGAAGLMATIFAARQAPEARVVALDGAKSLGAKILVAGGGRCNVTHHAVDERSFNGSSPNSIRNVLRRFPVEETVRFFSELGVALKREETGKLFPTTDKARTVLDALLKAARDAGAEIRFPWRVESVVRTADGFEVTSGGQSLEAKRLVLASGGRSLPKSGSDGLGYTLAQSLGHSVTDHIWPALVPLTLSKNHFICGLSGLSAPVELVLNSGSGKKLASMRGSMLCAHFGVSGPAALDISRHFTHAKRNDPDTRLSINWLPDSTPEEIDEELRNLGAGSVIAALKRRLPERLAHALCEYAQIPGSTRGSELGRQPRRELVEAITSLAIPVTGDRGYNYAEVTAGGVPLAEVQLKTMESRCTSGLHLCGEICDVDGRIGGFNFQWAWASGFVAGAECAKLLRKRR